MKKSILAILTAMGILFTAATGFASDMEFYADGTRTFDMSHESVGEHQDWYFRTRDDVMERRHHVMSIVKPQQIVTGERRVETYLADSEPGAERNHPYYYVYCTNGTWNLYKIETNTNLSFLIVNDDLNEPFIFGYNNSTGYWQHYWDWRQFIGSGVPAGGCEIVVNNNKLFLVNAKRHKIYQAFWNEEDQWLNFQEVDAAE